MAEKPTYTDLGLQTPTPTSEFSTSFFIHMLNAMGVSYYKYGRVADAYPHKVNAIESLKARLENYLATGNTENLVDVANFAMIEFMHPSLENATYAPTDGSIGRVTHRDGIVSIPNRSILEKRD